MTNVISRWECPECGREGPKRHALSHLDVILCPGVPVERRYIAEDALLSDAAIMACDDAMERFVDDPAVDLASRDYLSARAGIVAAIEAAKGA